MDWHSQLDDAHEHIDQLQQELAVREQFGFEAFGNAAWAWSEPTFGTVAEKGPIGPLKHLIKEAGEAIADPTDVMEYADCLLLVLDASRRAGITPLELLATGWKKLAILKTRTYLKTPDGEISEHVK